MHDQGFAAGVQGTRSDGDTKGLHNHRDGMCLREGPASRYRACSLGAAKPDRLREVVTGPVMLLDRLTGVR